MADKEGFNEVLIEPLRQFARDSVHLVKKCTKPDRKEFTAIARATVRIYRVYNNDLNSCLLYSRTFVRYHVRSTLTLVLLTRHCSSQGIGFLIMGFIGFFVKLVHIPINNILVGN
jgi:protein transport protein SEC61 subunit gamma-like protein